jgi:hypothetical protein
VHGRGVQHRAPRREQGSGQQVPGHPGSGPGQQVGGSGRDDDQVGSLPDPDVRHLGHAGPHVSGHRLAGQRGPGGLADEPQRVGGRHDPDLMPGFGQQPEQLA